MSENEEMAWSRRKSVPTRFTRLDQAIKRVLMERHQDVLIADGPLILPPDDPQSRKVHRVTCRLVTALEEQDHHVISGASWPPRSQELGRVISEREAALSGGREIAYQPSGVAKSSFMPWRPVSSNPLKKLESADWNLYVVDLVRLHYLARGS